MKQKLPRQNIAAVFIILKYLYNQFRKAVIVPVYLFSKGIAGLLSSQKISLTFAALNIKYDGTM